LTGFTDCMPGYIGDSCQTPCPEGTFGEECGGTCFCDKNDCDHIKGCPPKSTATTPTTTSGLTTVSTTGKHCIFSGEDPGKYKSSASL
jgi:hypothetical protein